MRVKEAFMVDNYFDFDGKNVVIKVFKRLKKRKKN